MTDYNDIPEAHGLAQQRETVVSAMDMLDNGGFLSSLTVAPEPAAPGAAPTTAMPAMVAMQPPTPQNVVAMITNVLREQLRTIDDQLAALGVSELPPTAADA